MKRSPIVRKTGMRRSKTPMKRSPMRPTAPAAQTGRWYRKEARKLFMAMFRGAPCLMTGRTVDQLLRDEGGNYIPTDPHHLLPVSTYPEYEFTPENIVTLTRSRHSWAEDHPAEFRKWLAENAPTREAWVVNHSHHRTTRSESYKEIYERLRRD